MGMNHFYIEVNPTSLNRGVYIVYTMQNTMIWEFYLKRGKTYIFWL